MLPSVAMILSLICALALRRAAGSDVESALLQRMLSNYSTHVRPVRNASEVLIIHLNLALYRIISLDDSEQVMTTNCELIQKWNDYRLAWDPKEFNNVSSIHIPHHLVWLPDTVLYNGVSAGNHEGIQNTNVLVSSNGDITFLSHGIFQSMCLINVKFFPFDHQRCTMVFASWTHDESTIVYRRGEPTKDLLAAYTPNREFHLDNLTHEDFDLEDSCCESFLKATQVSISFTRRPPFYLFTFIMPCVVINAISLLVFCIPNTSGEKMTLGISAMLTMVVFFMNMKNDLPATDTISLLSLYYMITIALVASATAMSVAILNIHFFGSRGVRAPLLLRKVLLGYVARAVFVNVSNLTEEQLTEIQPRKKNSNVASSRSFRRLVRPFNISACHGSNNISDATVRSSMLDRDTCRLLESLSCQLLWLQQKEEAEKQRQQRQEEWYAIARVCDRVLLYTYVLVSVLATSCILTSSPHWP